MKHKISPIIEKGVILYVPMYKINFMSLWREDGDSHISMLGLSFVEVEHFTRPKDAYDFIIKKYGTSANIINTWI
jgi:hypothetical protein